MQYLSSKFASFVVATAAIILALLVLSSLSSCSFLDKPEQASIYQSNVKYIPPLAVPEHLNKDNMEDHYPLPLLPKAAPMTKVSIVPPKFV